MTSIFLTALITENVILTKFLGICSFLGTSNKEKNAIGMSISITFVVLVSSILTYLINNPESISKFVDENGNISIPYDICEEMNNDNENLNNMNGEEGENNLQNNNENNS